MIGIARALQMHNLKDLLLSKSYFDRVPAQSLVIDNEERYDRILGTNGKDFALFYSYNGLSFIVDMKQVPWSETAAYWYNPKDGTKTKIKTVLSNNRQAFTPPGEKQNGNDWVLVLDNASIKAK